MSLGLSRSSYYAMALKNESPKNIRLMNEIGALHTKYPFYGSRRITETLRASREQVNRKRIQRLMNIMNINCIYPCPKTTILDDQHRKYPYLLRGMTIEHSNKVWSTDITYIAYGKRLHVSLCSH